MKARQTMSFKIKIIHILYQESQWVLLLFDEIICFYPDIIYITI
jgi:hypothetical protein